PGRSVGGVCRAPCLRAEARDRTVPGALRKVLRARAEAGRDAGPKAFHRDVSPRAELGPEPRVALPIPYDRFLARVEVRIPVGCDLADTVSFRRLEPDDARAES